MGPADKPSPSGSPSRKEWAISYTQSDVDTIREQIQQDQAARRRLLVIALMIAVGALVVVVIALSTSYSLYLRGQSTNEKLVAENASLKSAGADCSRELEQIRAKEAKSVQIQAEAQDKLAKLIPAAFGQTLNGRDAIALAQMIYGLPEHSVAITEQPPNDLFHNWKVKTDNGMEVYTLVGGFADGKWIVYSDLISRR
jgi:hypothetical protein